MKVYDLILHDGSDNVPVHGHIWTSAPVTIGTTDYGVPVVMHKDQSWRILMDRSGSNVTIRLDGLGDTAPELVTQLRLKPGVLPEFSMRIDVDLTDTVHFVAVDQDVVYSQNIPKLTVVRPCRVADWTDYYMSDLQNMTMRSMTYTEVL